MNVIPDYDMVSFDVNHVFGIKVKGWIKDPCNYSTGGWGLTLTLRDMAKFGLLYQRKGVWDKKQIISKSWLEESVQMNPKKYGYLWWLREDDGMFSYSAMGSGGSIICCVPEKEIVIAIASKVISRPRDRWILIKDYILSSLED